ncbi:ABC transporter permease subunit [Paenibacillus sp. GCM10027627]|uniref:ABC transporter permease subunit n=1 Tax=unclassified Paenibacillus TaxID=185978 RepID=UPI003633F368
MNVFSREMKASVKSLLIWTVGILLMVWSGMAKYSTLSESSDAVGELMADLPKAMQAILGIGSLDLSTAMGYFGMLYLYLLVMAAIHSSMLGANMMAKEERDKTAEFLLVKPISRARLLAVKLTAAIVLVLLFNAAMTASSFLFVVPYTDGGASAIASDMFRLMLGMLLAQLLFLSIGMAIASAGRRPKRAVAISAAVMMATFLLSIGMDLGDGLDALGYFTPFKYFEASMLLTDGFDPVYVALSAAVSAISLAIAFAGYTRRDMQL